MSESHYIEPSQENGRTFFINFQDKGKVVMLNLLRFKKTADYSGLEELKPNVEISGREAYNLYMKLVQPIIEKVGSRVLFFGECSSFLIGPENEKWDRMLLVEHQSAADFIAFAKNEEYLKHAGHRTAALEDSRLLPITPKG